MQKTQPEIHYSDEGSNLTDLQGSRFFPGQKIDQYILGEQIASGGMGQVFLAFQESMNRHVAIKFLPEVDSDNADTVARFEREVLMISKLEHPHIVPVYGFGGEYGFPFIVMRHMKGGTLREHFQDGKLNLQRILAVVDQVVTALDYAHEQGIIHRDLKPSNVFLDEQQNAYLADFGLAKTVSGSHDLTRTDEGISGTPEYMSPEQVRGLKLDGRTDIYSLGVIVFQLLAGQAPFSGSNPMETVLKQISDPVPSLHAFQPELPKEVDTVFNKVLAKNPDKRYQSGKEFTADLNEVLGSSPKNWIPSADVSPAVVENDNDTIPGDTGEQTAKHDVVESDSGSSAKRTIITDPVKTSRFYLEPQRLIWTAIAAAVAVLALAIGGYFLYNYINNPIRQLGPLPVALAQAPRDMEFDGQGGVWVISHDENEVLKFRTDCADVPENCGSILARVNAGDRPQFVVPGPNGVYVGQQLAQGLIEISLDGSQRRVIEFPYIPADAVVNDSIWITSGANLIELDFEGTEIESFGAGSVAGALYQMNDYIWVALEGEGRLRRFDLQQRTFDLDAPLSVEANQLISLSGDTENHQIWATFNRQNLLIQIDSLSGELLTTSQTSELPLDVGVYDGRVWIVAEDGNEVAAHNGLTGSYIGAVTDPGLEGPSTLAIEPCGENCAFLWVASESSGVIRRIDIGSIE